MVQWAVGSTASGYADGPFSSATFAYPFGIATDTAGNMFVSQDGEYTTYLLIRMLSTSGYVSTIAGSSTYGTTDGFSASFQQLYFMAVASDGRLYAADKDRVRKVDLSG